MRHISIMFLKILSNFLVKVQKPDVIFSV